MVPWLVVLPRLGAGSAWLMGIVLGLVFYRISFNWLFGIYGPLGGISIVVCAILMGYSFRIAKLLIDRFGLAAMPWAAPMAFMGQEVVRSESLPLMRFSYAGWGYSQAHNLWVAQIASLGGQEELDLIHWLNHHALSSILVLTKADKLSKTKQINQQNAFTKEFDIDKTNLIIFSAKTRQGKKNLWFAIEKLLDNDV